MAGHPPYPPPTGGPGPRGPFPQHPGPAQSGYGPPGGGMPPPAHPGAPGHPPPPGYPPPGGGAPPPRRWGWLIGGIAGGVALILLVGGGVTWAVLATPAPFSRIAGCDALLPERALDRVSGVDPDDIKEERHSEDVTINSDENAEDGVLCSSGDTLEYTATAQDVPVQVLVSRADTETAEDDYAEMSRHIREARTIVEDEYGADLSEGSDVDAEGGAEITKRELDTGDGGFAFVIDDPTGEYVSGGDYGEGGSVALALFTVRNALVNVEYRGSGDGRPEEKLDTAVDLAADVEVNLSRQSETE